MWARLPAELLPAVLLLLLPLLPLLLPAAFASTVLLQMAGVAAGVAMVLLPLLPLPLPPLVYPQW
jgi:hypothetical protein